MSETNNLKENNSVAVKPVSALDPDIDDVVFPPFPDPTDDDFDEDISAVEREYYKVKFPDLNAIRSYKLHCTACDRHLGCAARNESRMRVHPMLRTLMCHTCHTFYNSGEFDKGDDGSELYCRWCGQGGQVYCCSDCPHVFCAKCIKRNLGVNKIKEIENTDDWKCFKCSPTCLWDLRATCWALLRYCDLKNKITYKTQDERLKEEYEKDCATDHTLCCKNKRGRKEKETPKRKTERESTKIKEEKDVVKKREKEQEKKDVETTTKKDSAASVIAKIPSTIQVKKFASINNEENKTEKKAQKRSISPKNKPILIRNTVPIQPFPKFFGNLPSAPKKLRMMSPATITPIRIAPAPQIERMLTPPNTYGINRYRQRHPASLPNLMPFNGFGSTNFTSFINNDNINLSLDSLTQGLDMSSVGQSDDIVCMPDLPLEPLCEVTEDNDDDVQCITPIVAAPKVPNIIQKQSQLPDITPDNIIQMTDDDVTVNSSTGGLKFRVDPQTLSSNKMYRLPDGRIFAINANPNMPGGYSATIVAVTDNCKTLSKGTTYAAKLNPVHNSSQSKSGTPKSRARVRANQKTTNSTPNTPKASATDTATREYDMNVPVEWYRYNLIDAIDALSYSTSRLHKLRKEATTNYLRSRTIPEMKKLHKTLDRLLNTSVVRFTEIKTQLNKEMRIYIEKKMGNYIESDAEDDDDDVEILPNNEEPISIDENSVDSIANDSQEVDLTTVGSDHNESGEKENSSLSFINHQSSLLDKSDIVIAENKDEPSKSASEELENKTGDESTSRNGEKQDEHSSENNEKVPNCENEIEGENEIMDVDKDVESDMNGHEKNEKDDESDKTVEKAQNMPENYKEVRNEENNEDKVKQESNENSDQSEKEKINDTIEKGSEKGDDNSKDGDIEKCQDTEMSEELIENLLKDDACDDNAVAANDIPDLEDA